MPIKKTNTYDEFVDKFRVKKTTDDCYTPDKSYNMSRQRYGIPYLGSKWRLADWILSYFPDAPVDAPKDGERVFVDLFAGGCAMTHAAIKSGRFDKVIANDLSVAPQVFKKAVEYGADDWKEWVSREDFKALDTNTVDLECDC